MRLTLPALALLCGLFIAGAPTLAASANRPASETPYSIYGRARDVWMAQRYPAYLAYTIAVNVDEKGVPKANHYHSVYDALHDVVHVDAISDEERTAPHVPTGVNFHLRPKRQFHTIVDKRVGNPEEAVDFLGIPLLAPNYSFGIAPYVAPQQTANGDDLVRAIRQQFKDPMPAAKAQELNTDGHLKEIASVSTTLREYAITLDGVESLGNRDTYHLSLRPTRDPGRFRLRELWIDTQTFETAQLVTAGNFTVPQAMVPWTVTFDDVDGVRYISSETANAPVSIGPHTYDRASISFQAIAPTQWSPLWVSAFTSTSNKAMIEPKL
ncbi:MAG TPA: hypothetical protein VIG51_08260 [Candidatus Baltobacteraceae bacterium]|jgi:hypothetical protein